MSANTSTATTRLSYTRRATMLGLLTAIAYVVMLVGRVPVVMFLKYDPKDIIITMGGFLFGPMSAFMISLVVSLVEMVTVSETGPWGLLMNVLASCSFACTAAFIYKKRQTLAGAVTGLVAGVVLMVPIMLLWNYLVTPFYMGWPREDVAAILFTAFLPFNLLKGGLNATLTLLIYKPLVRALRAANMLPPRDDAAAGDVAASRKATMGVSMVAAMVLVSCVLVVLVLQGII